MLGVLAFEKIIGYPPSRGLGITLIVFIAANWIVHFALFSEIVEFNDIFRFIGASLNCVVTWFVCRPVSGKDA